jgi:hypothetical protein
MCKIVSQKLAKGASSKELDKTFEQIKSLLEYTQNHIDKTDMVVGVTIRNDTHTLIIKPNA